MPIPSTEAAAVNRKRRLLLASAAYLFLTSLTANALAGTTRHQEVLNARINRIYSVDQALRIPAIAALFDERNQPILQLDYADFEAVTRPLNTNLGSQMWGLSVDLPTGVGNSTAHLQSLQSMLASVVTTKHEILNALAVISCNTQTSVLQLLRQHQALLTEVVTPTDMHGLAAVTDESASTPRMTMLFVTMPKT
jgi:hypothetical protein